MRKRTYTRRNLCEHMVLRTVSTLLFAGSAVSGHAQVLYNNGASITIKPGAIVTVNGNLTNAAGATVNNTGSLNISGNTVNNGTISAPAASTLRFQGSGAQTLSGSSPVSAKDVIVNNAAGITLATTLNVDGVMTFTNGMITATNSSYPVVFSANASIGNTPTDASHIDGYVRKNGTGAFTFPVGNATKYQPVGVNLSANGSGMTVRYYGSDPGSAPFGIGGSSPTALVAVNRAEYWDLIPGSTATGTVTIYFDGYKNSGINSTADLRVAHLTGGQWLNEGGTATGSTASGTVTSTSISTFSPFTIGSISSNSPLPVNLMAFAALWEGTAVRVNWQTAAETSGTVFDLERSADGRVFESVRRLNGTGTGNAYTYLDVQPYSTINYYRLKLSEAGGQAAYSNTVLVRKGADEPAGSTSLFPLPATDQVTLATTNPVLMGSQATIRDAQGKPVASFTVQSTVVLTISAWPSGMYTLTLADGSSLKLVKL